MQDAAEAWRCLVVETGEVRALAGNDAPAGPLPGAGWVATVGASSRADMRRAKSSTFAMVRPDDRCCGLVLAVAKEERVGQKKKKKKKKKRGSDSVVSRCEHCV